MSLDDALVQLRVGDEVAIREGMSDTYHILTIAKVESRGIIELQNGNRYRLNGTSIAKGDKWYRPSNIEPVTDAIRQQIKKRSLVSELSKLNYNDWKAMDIAVLEGVYALVKEYTR